jgi:hypothetical protein
MPCPPALYPFNDPEIINEVFGLLSLSSAGFPLAVLLHQTSIHVFVNILTMFSEIPKIG